MHHSIQHPDSDCALFFPPTHPHHTIHISTRDPRAVFWLTTSQEKNGHNLQKSAPTTREYLFSPVLSLLREQGLLGSRWPWPGKPAKGMNCPTMYYQRQQSRQLWCQSGIRLRSFVKVLTSKPKEGTHNGWASYITSPPPSYLLDDSSTP